MPLQMIHLHESDRRTQVLRGSLQGHVPHHVVANHELQLRKSGQYQTPCPVHKYIGEKKTRGVRTKNPWKRTHPPTRTCAIPASQTHRQDPVPCTQVPDSPGVPLQVPIVQQSPPPTRLHQRPANPWTAVAARKRPSIVGISFHAEASRARASSTRTNPPEELDGIMGRPGNELMDPRRLRCSKIPIWYGYFIRWTTHHRRHTTCMDD